MPRPIETLLRIFDEPVPAYTMSGFDSETSTAPMEATGRKPSETFTQECPASVVFQTLPPVEPHIEGVGLGWDAGDRGHAPSALRPDHAVAQAGPQRRVKVGLTGQNRTCQRGKRDAGRTANRSSGSCFPILAGRVGTCWTVWIRESQTD